MGELGKQQAVKMTLDKGRAAMIEAISDAVKGQD